MAHSIACSSHFQARFERRNAKRSRPKCYHRKVLRADGVQTWQGGRDLASSAEYPLTFCRNVLKIWQEEVKAKGLVDL